MHILDLMEPTTSLRPAWCPITGALIPAGGFSAAAVCLEDMQDTVIQLFRQLGGATSVRIIAADATPIRHRRALQARLVVDDQPEEEHLPRFDGRTLRLPPVIAAFPDPALNRAAYLWLGALAAVSSPSAPTVPRDGLSRDLAQIRANAAAAARAYALCPDLRRSYRRMARLCLEMRPDLALPASEAATEQAIRDQLRGLEPMTETLTPSRWHLPFTPVPIWLTFESPQTAEDTALPGRRACACPESESDCLKHRDRSSRISWLHVAAVAPPLFTAVAAMQRLMAARR